MSMTLCNVETKLTDQWTWIQIFLAPIVWALDINTCQITDTGSYSNVKIVSDIAFTYLSICGIQNLLIKQWVVTAGSLFCSRAYVQMSIQ